MSVIEHQTVKLISGSTKLEYNKPIDADALIEIKGFRDIHHKDIAKLVDASPDLLEACKAAVGWMAASKDRCEAIIEMCDRAIHKAESN